MDPITNLEERDAVIAKVASASAKKAGVGSLMATDWTRAKWLARGERAVCIQGGFRNSVIHSPAHARQNIDYDRLLYFGSQGVLCHEEPANPETMRQIGL